MIEITEQKFIELLKQAYRWGKDNGSNRSEKNFNDFLKTESVSETLSMENFHKNISKQKDCPKEFQEVFNKDFWNII